MGGAGVWVDVGEFGFLLEEETNPGSTRAMPLTEASHLVSAASSLKLCTWARLWICPRPLTHTTYPPPRTLPGPSPTLTPVLPLSWSQVQSGECGAGVDGGRISRSTEGRRPAVVAALLKNPADKPTEARARLHRRDAKPRVVFPRRGHGGIGWSRHWFWFFLLFFSVAAAPSRADGRGAASRRRGFQGPKPFFLEDL